MSEIQSQKAERKPSASPLLSAGRAITNFQPAKSSDEKASVFTNCGKTDRAARKKERVQPQQKLTRVAFRVSRLMEFCTKRELQNQTGHSDYQWLLVVLKELMDNALDACEEAEVAPVISIKVNPDSGTIIIQDNAGGIETDTIKSILDYTIRVSSREAYVSPTRGAQGKRAQDHSCHGLCARPREGQQRCGRGDYHRNARRQASNQVRS
jgi:hypothetical protein